MDNNELMESTKRKPQAVENQADTGDGQDVTSSGAWPAVLYSSTWPNYKGSVSPHTIRQVLEEYISTPDTLKSILSRHGVTYSRWVTLRRAEHSIGRLHDQLRREKAQLLADTAREQYDNIESMEDLPDYAYTENNQGVKSLSMAGVRLLKDKYEALVSGARMAEQGKVGKDSEPMHISTQINAGQVNIDMRELLDADIEQLQRIEWDGA